MGRSNFTSSQPQKKPLKSPPRLGLKGLCVGRDMYKYLYISHGKVCKPGHYEKANLHKFWNLLDGIASQCWYKKVTLLDMLTYNVVVCWENLEIDTNSIHSEWVEFCHRNIQEMDVFVNLVKVFSIAGLWKKRLPLMKVLSLWSIKVML